MTVDRWLGILGIALGVAGVIVSAIGKMTIAGLVLFAVGLLLAAYAGWTLFVRRPFLIDSLMYRYVFKDPTGKLVSIDRRMTFTVVGGHVNSIWARSLTSTGQYDNFKTSIGTIAAVEHLGGAVHVRVDFHVPLKRRRYDWVLSYDAVDAFTAQAESVSYTCLEPTRRGGLEVTFHPTRAPHPVERITYHAGRDELLDGTIEITAASLTAAWEFRPRVGTEYFLRWVWP